MTATTTTTTTVRARGRVTSLVAARAMSNKRRGTMVARYRTSPRLSLNSARMNIATTGTSTMVPSR